MERAIRPDRPDRMAPHPGGRIVDEIWGGLLGGEGSTAKPSQEFLSASLSICPSENFLYVHASSVQTFTAHGLSNILPMAFRTYCPWPFARPSVRPFVLPGRRPVRTGASLERCPLLRITDLLHAPALAHGLGSLTPHFLASMDRALGLWLEPFRLRTVLDHGGPTVS